MQSALPNTPLNVLHLGLLLLTQAIGIGFWVAQNRMKVGGGLSFVKGLWLTYAVTLWFVLPLIFFFTSAGAARNAYGLLALSMLLRGGIEIFLCYVTKTWKAAYGVGHDSFHLTLAIVIGASFAFAQPPLNWFLLAVLFLTIVSLLTELLFVRWFLRATGGPANGVYFVSSDPRFDAINRGTALIFYPQYALFLILIAASFALQDIASFSPALCALHGGAGLVDIVSFSPALCALHGGAGLVDIVSFRSSL